MSSSNFTWINFYSELADKLLEYRDNRPALIEKIYAAYRSIGMDVPTLDSTEKPSDIDPFTVFGLFNKGITEANRLKIIDALGNEFGVAAEKPTDFDGIPILNNLSATFYAFTGDHRRGPEDIEHLWNAFETALAYADTDAETAKSAFAVAYDNTIGQPCLGWKLTMGFFWARPHKFVNLDSRNRWYMGNIGAAGETIANIVPRQNSATIHSGKEYLHICDTVLENLNTPECPFASIPELSLTAFIESERVNGEKTSADKKAEKTGGVGDDGVKTQRCWLYAPGSGAYLWKDLQERKQMTIGWEEIGDLSEYGSKEDMKDAMRELIDPSLSFKNAAHATWQFANEIQVGDVIYVKRGMHEVIGRGIVKSDYRFEANQGEDLCNIRDIEWTHVGSWEYPGQAPVKTLTNMTPYTQTVSYLKSLFENEDSNEELAIEEVTYPTYTKEDFLSDVFMEEENYDTLVDLLRIKKNVILQGAPGVGKTYAAKRLAYSIMGEKDVSRVMMVQFHQSYSYEDFIEGYRPSADKFDLVKGAFYEFCKKAEDDEGRDYFFIIDEINRGNLSKIFGELFMLIESDKRGPKNTLQLLYSRELFHVPSNVHLIGMMNTADRSLAMLDYALRRRFAFVDLTPGFSTEGFATYLREVNSPEFTNLVSCVERLNGVIAEDDTLGEGFCIGHSYFCGLENNEAIDTRLTTIVEYELIPLLKEYWFDEPTKVKEWSGSLRKAIK